MLGIIMRAVVSLSMLCLLASCASEAASGQPVRMDGLYRLYTLVRGAPGALNAETYLFARNGDVCRRLRAFKARDATALRRDPTTPAGDCGTYSIRDGRISFEWGDGRTQSTYFKVEKGAGRDFAVVEFRGYYWGRLQPWPGRTLSGSYTSSPLDLGYSDESCNPGFPNFARANQLTLTFGPRGEFAARHNSYGAPDRTVRGSYRITGSEIEFTIGEQRLRCGLHVLPGETGRTPRVLYLHARPYLLDS